MVAIPVPLDSAAKAASASEEAAEAGEPAGSQVQSGESGSLPPVRHFPRRSCIQDSCILQHVPRCVLAASKAVGIKRCLILACAWHR